jgi:general secretion pathway protein J
VGEAMTRNGFTLIELMVGLFIFGLMAAAGTSLLSSASGAVTQAQAMADDTGDLARLASLLNADCAQAALRPWRDVQGRPQPAFGVADGALFTLVRRGWANPAGAARASVQRVSYRLEGGRLIRRSAAMIDGSDAGSETVLIAGITAAQLRFHGPQGWQAGWTAADALPRAIELTLSGPRLGVVRQVLTIGISA